MAIDLETTSLPPKWYTGSYFIWQPMTSGAVYPAVYSVTGGALPAGLAINPSTGEVTGTPTTAGTYSATISATDSAMTTDSESYTFEVRDAIQVAAPAYGDGTVGAAYSATPTISGGYTPFYGFTLYAGSLPPGLTLNATTGEISGTPTTAGSYAYAIAFYDSRLPAPHYYAKTFTGALVIRTAGAAMSVGISAQSAKVNETVTLTATGNVGAVQWSVDAPDGFMNYRIGGTGSTVSLCCGNAGSYEITATDIATGERQSVGLRVKGKLARG